MPLIIAITVIIQAFFIYHVIRNNRPYWWAFLILSTPIVGCVIYYFVEIFPHSQEHRSVRRTGRNILRALNPDAAMRKRIDEADICGSVANKTALAEECLAAGFTEDAIHLYQSCLSSAHVNDPLLMFGLARAYLDHGSIPQTLSQLQQLQNDHPKFKPLEVRLLQARALNKAAIHTQRSPFMKRWFPCIPASKPNVAMLCCCNKQATSNRRLRYSKKL